MNIVQISAGLGNQMFQYALYLAMKHVEPCTKIDISIYQHRAAHNGYELERVFDIHPDIATLQERNHLADVGKDIWSEIRRKWLRHPLPCIGTLYREKSGCYQPEVFSMRNTYFAGWWQSERYFLSIADEVRQSFRFIHPLLPIHQQLADTISDSSSVSIHIRRGDYMKKRRIADVGSVCSRSYYRNAIAYINQYVPNARYFVFSDNPEEAKVFLELPEAIYISGNTGKNAYLDMQLMSMCRHHIIANSSFSWWGAWLDPRPNKMVIAPATWFRNEQKNDILPPNWIPIPVEK